MDEGDRQGEILHSHREALKKAQTDAQLRIDNGDIVEGDGSISSDAYILGIDIDHELLPEDLDTFASIRDRKIGLNEFKKWVNSVDDQVSIEGEKLGLHVHNQAVTSPNFIPSSPEYSRFFNRHPRERFIKWLAWFGRNSLK